MRRASSRDGGRSGSARWSGWTRTPRGPPPGRGASRNRGRISRAASREHAGHRGDRGGHVHEALYPARPVADTRAAR
jgi:hypothetical protein